MTVETIQVSVVLPTTPQRLYEAWLDSEQHQAMTGQPAKIDARVGGSFHAAAGAIEGRLLELVPAQRIALSWRSPKLFGQARATRVELSFEAVGKSTRLTVTHSDLPLSHGESAADRWVRLYCIPMLTYFEPAAAPRTRRTPAKKAVAKKAVAKKTVAKKTVAKKTVAKKTAAKKTVAKKAIAKKAIAKKASPKAQRSAAPRARRR